MEVDKAPFRRFLVLTNSCLGICAGKNSIAKYLIQKHGFRPLQLTTEPRRPNQLEASDHSQLLNTNTDTTAEVFYAVDDFVEFVTKRWREHWVITDLSDEELLRQLLFRPFFLLVGVDAPISLRWRRFTDRSKMGSIA